MRVFSIHHSRQGLREVERIGAELHGVADRMRHCPGVAGVATLNTCNRVEILLDTAGEASATDLRAALNEHFTEPPQWDLYLGEAALKHVFRVASGLDSMVVGEREIAGQLRRALIAAQERGHASLALTLAMDEALKTSRRVAHETALEGAGRSVVNAGLELVGVEDWHALRTVIIGTGSYAGAVVHALRARGVSNIAVHSVSGRGAEFAAARNVDHITSLSQAMASADLVVTCRGLGTLITPSEVTGSPVLLDLSLPRDVDPAVDLMPGVRVIALTEIQQAVAPMIEQDTHRADAIVADGIAATLAKLRARIVDPAVVGLREAVMGLVDDEVARLPNRPITHEDAAVALRRLATRLLHIPSTRARVAAESGRTDEYLTAMAELYGIGGALGADQVDDRAACPVTDLQMTDLKSMQDREAI